MRKIKMKATQLFITTSLAFFVSAGMTWAAETPIMKMTTEVPPGVATPDKLASSLGTLTSVDGVPDGECGVNDLRQCGTSAGDRDRAGGCGPTWLSLPLAWQSLFD